MFILYDPARDRGGRRRQAQIMDIAPTVLKYMGEPIPADMQGKAIEA
jgi:bisphosphoglycerate-independent phosphoglycerate mutase (AlkP superfamily)